MGKGARLEKPTVRELSRFSPQTYVKLIKYLDQSYKIAPFCDMPKEDVPYVVLRHDVDVSLFPALKMAKVEHEMGVKSTYFILVSSMHYNSFEGRNASMIKEISSLGHEVGLHYDSEQYKRYSQDAAQALRMEVHALESFLGKKVTSISCHAPRGPNSFMRVKGYIDADNPRLREVYVHDSQRMWTVKSLDVLLNKHPKRVQLLLHPNLWEGKIARRTKLDNLLLDVSFSLYRVRTLATRLIHSRESVQN
jgi:peptidoglycan/xylan/chitin deacetylase (PgdA/CDA1 family)